MIKTSVCLVLDLRKVCALMKSWNRVAVEVLVTFSLARSIEEQTRSIESRAECYFLQISNSALAHLKCLGFYIFAPGI